MNPTNLMLEDCDTLCSSSIILSDKQTQTSLYFQDSKPSLPRPVPINYDSCDNKAGPKVFEVIEVIKDPEDSQSVTVIKDTFTEEVIDSSTPSHTSLSNRYKYCREVITPFLKSGSKECPPFLARDELVNNADQEEGPDYPPCDEVYDGAKDIKDKIGIKDKDMDQNGSETKSSNEPTTKKCLTINNDKKCTKKDKCPDCKKKGCKGSSQSLFSSEHCQENDVCEKAQSECPKIDCKIKSCLSKCLKGSVDLAKSGSAACLKVIGIKPPKCPEDKPTYYVLEKPSKTSSSTCASTKSSMHRILDSQSGTISSIKSAVQGFFGSVYKKTKDAVSLVTSESCKRLGFSQQSESCATESASKSKTNVSQKSSKPISSCAYEQLGEESQLLGSIGRPSMEILQPAIDVMGKIASKVESTVSYLNEFGIEKVLIDSVESKMNKSSLYDKAPTPPRTISQELEPPPSGMFEMIKTKIYSIFQEDHETDDDESQDSDEDEKLFNKFSEQ